VKIEFVNKPGTADFIAEVAAMIEEECVGSASFDWDYDGGEAAKIIAAAINAWGNAPMPEGFAND
jgi:hypothetical protein